MNKGFLYLVAIIDWYSRYVLSWELSNTLDADFCLRALDKALLTSQPEIFNSDQGYQFTSNDFTEKLEKAGIQIQRVEEVGCLIISSQILWRTVKYEEVYIHSYDTVKEARESLDNYFRFYNGERFHQSLGYRTPQEVYLSKTINKQEEIIHLKEACFLS